MREERGMGREWSEAEGRGRLGEGGRVEGTGSIDLAFSVAQY